eukprot:CAMPEP_0116047466 /NCGR_PEP_ID=MMETSP0321-20121206/28914_1 /TAXON_ID=163516 /ORGANISM="Leptocylindrus danicus var. danicus, Strain B650" /LENGTH=370 /DNA_ID=CAMNT_0003529363 /DNA_START=11 /DNA_END=1121 /DNA_ORIENTATION=+
MSAWNLWQPKLTTAMFVFCTWVNWKDIQRFVEQHRASTSLSFRTAPSPKKIPELQVADDILRFVVVGDLGTSSSAKRTMELALQEKVDLIVCAGDLAYAKDGTGWDRFFETFRTILSSTPFMPVPGNHDVERDATTFELFSNYESRFAMPQTRPAIKLPGTNSTPKESALGWYGTYDYGNSFFSYSAGLATFIHLNSYTNSTPGSPQYTFVSHTLQNIDRSVTPWVIVTAHCPFYSPYEHHKKEAQALMTKQSLEPLFVEFRVNVVFSGHVHAYSRSKHVSMGEVDYNRTSPLYILNGDGGKNPLIEHGASKKLLQDAFNASNDAFDGENYPFDSFDLENNAFLVMDVLNATYIRLKRVLSTESKKGQIW